MILFFIQRYFSTWRVTRRAITSATYSELMRTDTGLVGDAGVPREKERERDERTKTSFVLLKELWSSWTLEAFWVGSLVFDVRVQPVA